MKIIQPQEVWFADFPFRDDKTQSKDRPVIVLEVDGETCQVLSMKVTRARRRFLSLKLNFSTGRVSLCTINQPLTLQTQCMLLKKNFGAKLGG